MLKDVSGKESVVYKCVAESDPGGFDGWLNKAIDTFGVNAYNLVGGASSANQYSGPTIPDVAAKLNKRPQCAHGGVTIAEKSGSNEPNAAQPAALLEKLRIGHVIQA